MTALVAVAVLLSGLQPVEAPVDYGPGQVEVIGGVVWMPAGDSYAPDPVTAAATSVPTIEPAGPLAVDPGDETPATVDPFPPYPPPDVLTVPAVAPTPEAMIRARWAGTGDADTMVRIARRESGLSCTAANPRSSAVGLFQTLSLHQARAARLGLTWQQVATDCAASIALAWDLYREVGTSPWRLTR